jgi:hypothetical protein
VTVIGRLFSITVNLIGDVVNNEVNGVSSDGTKSLLNINFILFINIRNCCRNHKSFILITFIINLN